MMPAPCSFGGSTISSLLDGAPCSAAGVLTVPLLQAVTNKDELMNRMMTPLFIMGRLLRQLVNWKCFAGILSFPARRRVRHPAARVPHPANGAVPCPLVRMQLA